MSTETTTEKRTVNSKVEQVDINLDEIFAAAPGAAEVITQDEKPAKSIFSRGEKADMSFADPDVNDTDDLNSKVEAEETTIETVDEEGKEKKVEKFDIDDVIDSIDQSTEEEEREEKRGRKSINGISDVFSKLIKEDKIVPFDDDKELDDYTAKDWEELIQANLDERANQVRRETPKQFFESLPEELQIAARYVADGGQDMKGLFATLASVEENRGLDIKKEKDQERIITEYLSATGYGNSEEIAEEIEIWKDLGKLESQAGKFKPKLDKMQEKIVARKLQEQQLKKKQQEQASQQYMKNVYETLKGGAIGEIKLDKKTQAMIYNGLVQPSYPSVSGKNTNLLGHLLEKYQFVEPNYGLISEALWLLQDPTGYKAKIMDKGAQEAVEKTVRKLKTEQANAGGSASLGVKDSEPAAQRTAQRKIPRANNIFKRI